MPADTQRGGVVELAAGRLVAPAGSGRPAAQPRRAEHLAARVSGRSYAGGSPT